MLVFVCTFINYSGITLNLYSHKSKERWCIKNNGLVKRCFHLMLIKDEKVLCYALISPYWPVPWCRAYIQDILQPPSSLILPRTVILCWYRDILYWYVFFCQQKTCDENISNKRNNLQNIDVCSLTQCLISFKSSWKGISFSSFKEMLALAVSIRQSFWITHGLISAVEESCGSWVAESCWQWQRLSYRFLGLFFFNQSSWEWNLIYGWNPCLKQVENHVIGSLKKLFFQVIPLSHWKLNLTLD